jgi:hypothetical protein
VIKIHLASLREAQASEKLITGLITFKYISFLFLILFFICAVA